MPTLLEPRPPASSPPPRRRRRKRKSPLQKLVIFAVLLLVFSLGSWFLLPQSGPDDPKVRALSRVDSPDWVEEKYLPQNSNSRTGTYLFAIENLVIHYVGNPSTTAEQNWGYFSGPETTVNSHFLVGLEGEILQCLPLEERSSASNYRNGDTISIEVCHPDESGVFTQESYDSLVTLTAWVCSVSELTEEDLLRHFDVTGKLCPLYFSENEEAWESFRGDVKLALEEF